VGVDALIVVTKENTQALSWMLRNTQVDGLKLPLGGSFGTSEEGLNIKMNDGRNQKCKHCPSIDTKLIDSNFKSGDRYEELYYCFECHGHSLFEMSINELYGL
jgi:hypothetical protein